MQLRRVVGLVILVCAFQSSRAFGQVVATWTDGNGDWNTPSNWSTGVVPDSTTNVFITDGTSSVTLNQGPGGAEGFVANLQVASGNSLTAGGLTVSGPQILNNGQITQVGVALGISGTVNLQGTGTLSLENALVPFDANSTLINQSTIQGQGGIFGLNLVNSVGGVINSNVPGQFFGLPQVTLSNTGGLVEATNGGTLCFCNTGAPSNNQGGTMAAIGPGSMVLFSSGSGIQGGTVTTANGGMIGPLGNDFGISLDGSTHGPLTISAGSTWDSRTSSTTIFGTIINNGSMLFGGGSQELPSVFIGDTVLKGTGTLTLGVNNDGLLSMGGGGTLTNQSTIQGAGNISPGIFPSSGGNLAIVNQGLIDANVSGQTLTLSPTSLQNAGTLQVESASTMSLNIGSSSVTNTGTFNIKAGGTMILDITAGSGTLTNSGNIILAGSTLSLNSGGNQNSVTLSGGGIVNLSGGTITGSSGSEVLINNDNTIQGFGVVSNLQLVNFGTINASGPNALTISGSLSNGLSGTLPTATVNVSGPGGLVVNGPVFNGGLINVESSILHINGSYGPNLESGILQLQGGSVGTILGNVGGVQTGFAQILITNSSLTVGGTFGMDTTKVNQGTLRIQGDVQQPDGGLLSLQGGSSAVVTGSFSGFGQHTIIDNSSLIVQGNYAGEKFGTTTLSNGAVLAVNGGINVGPAGFFNMSAGSLAVAGGDFLNIDSSVSLNNSTLQIAGTFTNTDFGRVTVGPNGLMTTSNYSQLDTFSSSGTYFTDVAGTLITNSYQQAAGTTTIERGGLIRANTFQATGGTVTVNGLLDPTAVEIDSGAILQGNGTIIGNVAMGGTLMPGSPNTPGTLTIVGNYEQLSTGMLQELIGPSSQSFLNVTGDVALDVNSFLDINLLNGYDPLGQTFMIMDYSSLVGQFSNGSSFWQDGFLWDISYGQHEIDVTAVSAPEPSSLLLLFLGLAALAFCTHKKMLTARHLA